MSTTILELDASGRQRVRAAMEFEIGRLTSLLESALDFEARKQAEGYVGGGTIGSARSLLTRAQRARDKILEAEHRLEEALRIHAATATPATLKPESVHAG